MSKNIMEREEVLLVRTLDLKELSDAEFEDATNVYASCRAEPSAIERLKAAAKRQADERDANERRLTQGI